MVSPIVVRKETGLIMGSFASILTSGIAPTLVKTCCLPSGAPAHWPLGFLNDKDSCDPEAPTFVSDEFKARYPTATDNWKAIWRIAIRAHKYELRWERKDFTLGNAFRTIQEHVFSICERSNYNHECIREVTPFGGLYAGAARLDALSKDGNPTALRSLLATVKTALEPKDYDSLHGSLEKLLLQSEEIDNDTTLAKQIVKKTSPCWEKFILMKLIELVRQTHPESVERMMNDSHLSDEDQCWVAVAWAVLNTLCSDCKYMIEAVDAIENLLAKRDELSHYEFLGNFVRSFSVKEDALE